MKVSAADIATLRSGDLITLVSTTAKVEATMLSANTAKVVRTDGVTTLTFTNANVTWASGANAQHTLTLASTTGGVLAEEVTIEFDLNMAERDLPQTGTKANVPGKMISTTAPNGSVLKGNVSVLLQIPLPNQS